MIFMGGHCDVEELGDTAATPPPEARLNVDPKIYPNQSVTGVSGRANIGALVYLSSDNDFTLTRPAGGGPIGMILEYHADGTADVFLFGLAGQCAIYLAGGGRQVIHLGTVVAELGAAGDMLKGIVATFHGKITSVYAICASAPVDADMNMDVELEINGTNLTGGTITLNFADAISDKKSGTAITAGNVVHEGDLIDVEAIAAGFVAGTAGDGIYNIYAEIEPLLGA
jgi:hypothetical protein